MAKAEIKAGATFDTLTQPELDKSLAAFKVSWRQELGRGIGFKPISRQGTADIAGAVRIGGTDSAIVGLGPDPGFVWSIPWLTVANLLTGATVTPAFWRNNDDSASLIRRGFTPVDNAIYQPFGGPGLILQPGEKLLFTCGGLTAGTVVSLTGQVTELPFNNAWTLV